MTPLTKRLVLRWVTIAAGAALIVFGRHLAIPELSILGGLVAGGAARSPFDGGGDVVA